MPAQPTEEFLNDGFLVELARTLDDLGFVADEHDFAPYRETMYELVGPISDALEASGREFELRNGRDGRGFGAVAVAGTKPRPRDVRVVDMAGRQDRRPRWEGGGPSGTAGAHRVGSVGHPP